MNTLTLAGDFSSAFTFVQNDFIDYYMRDINESQIKIYLYLLRSIGGNLSVSVSSIADFFNDSEKDVIRALKYLDKQKLITLEYDNDKQPAGIRLLRAEDNRRTDMEHEDIEKKPARPRRKKTYSADELLSFRERSDISELIYVAETYLKRTLSQNDLCALLYFNEELGFNADLIEYLIEYCVGNKKKTLSFMESVAQTWAEHGITSADEAKAYVDSSFPQEVYEVFKAFGIRGRAPVEAEADFVKKWLCEYNLPMDIIAEACSRTVIKIQKPSFEYADKILTGWHQRNVRQLSDVQALDQAHAAQGPIAPPKEKRSKKTSSKTSATDYDALVKELMEY